MVQPGSATVTLAASSARPARAVRQPAIGQYRLRDHGDRQPVPGDPVTATLTSPVRLSPGPGRLIANGCGVSAPAPMTRSVAVAPASPASVASTVTLTTCSARPDRAAPGEQIRRLDPSDPHALIVPRRGLTYAAATQTVAMTDQPACHRLRPALSRAGVGPMISRKNSSERTLPKACGKNSFERSISKHEFRSNATAGSRSAAAPGEAPGLPASDSAPLTDPLAMRALAHPVRVALIELLAVVDTLTATQASELLGESPANCAFHLRTLAKYGFVQEAGGGRGRERPWKSAERHITISTQQDDPQAATAAGRAQPALAGPLDRAGQAGVRRRALLPGWEHATGWSRNAVFLTPEEAADLRGADAPAA